MSGEKRSTASHRLGGSISVKYHRWVNPRDRMLIITRPKERSGAGVGGPTVERVWFFPGGDENDLELKVLVAHYYEWTKCHSGAWFNGANFMLWDPLQFKYVCARNHRLQGGSAAALQNFLRMGGGNSEPFSVFHLPFPCFFSVFTGLTAWPWILTDCSLCKVVKRLMSVYPPPRQDPYLSLNFWANTAHDVPFVVLFYCGDGDWAPEPCAR